MHQLGRRAGPREGGQAIFPGKVKVEWDKISDAGQCLMFMNTNWIHVTLEMDFSGDFDDGADIWMWICTCIWYLYLILIFVPDIDMCTWYWYLSMILIFVSDIYAFIWYLYLYLIVVPLSVHLYHYMKFAPVSDIENLNRGMVSVVRYHIDIVTPDQTHLWWSG